jgi:hypothetical protein
VTGRLTIAIAAPYSNSGRAGSWSDRKRWTLEDKLPDVLRELTARSIEHREERERRERGAAPRQHAWEAAMARAKERHAEHLRIEALRDQGERWKESDNVRGYCDAVEQTHPELGRAARWIAWARACAEQIDPTSQPREPPATPPPTTLEERRPYLDGWSRHEPIRRGR